MDVVVDVVVEVDIVVADIVVVVIIVLLSLSGNPLHQFPHLIPTGFDHMSDAALAQTTTLPMFFAATTSNYEGKFNGCLGKEALEESCLGRRSE